MCGRQTAPQARLDQVQKDTETRPQAIQFGVDNALNDAESAIAAKNFTDAQRAVERARVARNSNPNIFTPQEITAFDTRIETTQNRLDQERARWNAVQNAAQQKQTAKEMEARQQE